MIDEQAGMCTYTEGLALEELEAQRAHLVPDRVEMRRRKRGRKNPEPVGCVALYGAYPPGHPCHDGAYFGPFV